MSATIKEGSDRTICNQDKQQPLMLYNKHTDQVEYFRLDGTTDALMTVSYEHHEIHAGSHYFIHDMVDQAQSSVFDLQVTTPNTAKWAHMVFSVDSESENDHYIYEGATIILAGTAVTPRNNNRNSSNTSGLTIASIVNSSVANANLDTAVAGATELLHGKTGSKNVAGGAVRRQDEIILKQNTVYCFRSVFTVAGYITFVLSWYEHTDNA